MISFLSLYTCTVAGLTSQASRVTFTLTAPMAPPRRPTSFDYFLARYRYPLVASTLGLHFAHHQYIRRTEPALELAGGFGRAPSFSRPLRAGLGWAVVLAAVLTKTTLAQRVVVNYSDPVTALSSERKQWMRIPEAGL